MSALAFFTHLGVQPNGITEEQARRLLHVRPYAIQRDIATFQNERHLPNGNAAESWLRSHLPVAQESPPAQRKLVISCYLFTSRDGDYNDLRIQPDGVCYLNGSRIDLAVAHQHISTWQAFVNDGNGQYKLVLMERVWNGR